MANNSPRMRMSTTDRAKQFMPFSALKGLSEALAEKEKMIVPKRELSEEYKKELDYKFRQIRHKDIVSIIYYHNDNYIKITGMVSKIDTSAGYIQIVQTKIALSDISQIIRNGD